MMPFFAKNEDEIHREPGVSRRRFFNISRLGRNLSSFDLIRPAARYRAPAAKRLPMPVTNQKFFGTFFQESTEMSFLERKDRDGERPQLIKY